MSFNAAEYQKIARSLCWRARHCKRRHRRLAARNELVMRSQWLIKATANKFRYYRQLPADDLISEGQLALIRSIEEYDFSNGTPFNGYAGRAIFHAMYDAIYLHKHIIHVPRQHRKLNPGTPYHADALRSRKTASLKPADAAQFIDHRNPDLNIEDKEFIDWSLSQLDGRERKVIDLVYRIDAGHNKTHREISKLLNIARQRTSQIHSCAIRKMMAAARPLF